MKPQLRKSTVFWEIPPIACPRITPDAKHLNMYRACLKNCIESYLYSCGLELFHRPCKIFKLIQQHCLWFASNFSHMSIDISNQVQSYNQHHCYGTWADWPRMQSPQVLGFRKQMHPLVIIIITIQVLHLRLSNKPPQGQLCEKKVLFSAFYLHSGVLSSQSALFRHVALFFFSISFVPSW